jgi:hypothetical protein
VLGFERRVVASLVEHLAPELRGPVAGYAESAISALPEHLRAGLAAESLLLGACDRVLAALPGRSWSGLRLEALETSSIGPVRQYARLLQSLVLVAEHELAPAPAA